MHDEDCTNYNSIFFKKYRKRVNILIECHWLYVSFQFVEVSLACFWIKTDKHLPLLLVLFDVLCSTYIEYCLGGPDLQIF